MPWDITLKRRDGTPIGNRQALQEAIGRACPGVEFYREPSGAEKLAAIPAIEMAAVLRAHLLDRPAQRQGDLERRDFSLRFYLGAEEAEMVDVVDIEARGSTEHALPTLQQLATFTGCIVVDASGNIIAGTSEAS
jgi:hypothetical protein